MVCPSDHVPEPNLSFSPQGRTDFFLAPSSDKRKKTRKQKIVEWWALLFVHAKISGNVPRFVGGLFLAGAQVLGTPTREEICAMNYNYSEFKFPQIKAHPWKGVFRSRTPTEVCTRDAGIIIMFLEKHSQRRSAAKRSVSNTTTAAVAEVFSASRRR